MTPTTPQPLDPTADLDRATRRLIRAVHEHPSTLGIVTAGLQAFEAHLAREMPRDKREVTTAAADFQTALVLEILSNQH